MKQFDDIFRDKVKEAFNNYNAEHLSDAGWKAFSARRRRIVPAGFIIPLWAKAASIALVITAGSILTYKIANRHTENNRDALVYNTSPDAAVKEPSAGQSSITTEKGEPLFSTLEAENIVVQEYEKPGGSGKFIVKADVADIQIFDTAITGKESLPRIEYDQDFKEVVAEMKEDEIDRQNRIIEEALKEFLVSDTLSVPDEDKKSPEVKSAFMAGVSGMMAVIDKVVASSPGFAAGFYFEHQFSKRIAIRPGLAVAMQSSSLENNRGGSASVYAATLSDGTAGYTDSYNAHLNLIALELPVNVVVNILERGKSNLFLSAGASTMIYLSQSFTGTFVNSYTKQTYNAFTGEMTADTRYSTTEVEKKEGAFSHTDLLGLANISAGYSVPYGKTGNILFEPFVQLPLSSLSSLNVRILYSGLSVKVKFGR